MRDSEIIDKIRREDIPDTRRLRNIRLDSIGGEYPGEALLQKHFSQKFESGCKRLVQLPEDELRTVYSLTIPFSFAWAGSYSHSLYTHRPLVFRRWYEHECAFHLTTQKGLDTLLPIVTRHGISVEVEPAITHVFDLADKRNYQKKSSIVIPNKWDVQGAFESDGYMQKDQIVVYNQAVHAFPYVYSEDKKIVGTKEEWRFDNTYYEMRTEHTTVKTYRSDVTYSCPDHIDKPKDYLLPYLEEKRGKISSLQETVDSITIHVLDIGEPRVVYDPKWVDT